MSIKNNKTLFIVGALVISLMLFHLNLESYQEQRLYMLINDFLLSWQL